MKKGICIVSIIPMRREPSEKSEMVSQLLFGEVYSVAEETTGWCKIKTTFDNYSGWIDAKMVTPVSDNYYKSMAENSYPVVQSIVMRLSAPDESVLTITAGSTLGKTSKNGRVEIDSILYQCLDPINETSFSDPRKIIQTSEIFIHSPYLWGGRSPFGLDCSGFTQIVYKMIGIRLPRDARQQASLGQNIQTMTKLEAGDLVFFANEENQIIHVGLALPENKIIHCSGKVRIDKLDDKGIFNAQLNQYSHRLHSIRRIVGGGSDW
jgi:cell wall-associated NlpC family hydrolase